MYLGLGLVSQGELSLTDVLLPVAGDPAADLLSAILAGCLPQTITAVSRLRHTLPIVGFCAGAL